VPALPVVFTRRAARQARRRVGDGSLRDGQVYGSVRVVSPFNPKTAWMDCTASRTALPRTRRDPDFRELEPGRCVAEAAGSAPRRGVKLILRRFRFRQTQEYENGAVERLHFLGGQ